MRLLIILIILTLLAMLVDYYVYRRINRRHNFGRYFKIAYLLSAFLIDAIVVIALLIHNSAADGGAMFDLRVIMWAIGVFFLNFIPKLIYATISLGDYLVQYFQKGVSHLFGYTGVALGLAVAFMMVYSMFWGRNQIRVEHVELRTADLPKSFDGMKVAQFADTHIGALMNQGKMLQRMVDTINSYSPDIVVNSGDLINIHERELDEQILAVFSELKSKYGVYSVFGNHDLGVYINDTVRFPMGESVDGLIRKQREMGWRVLINESEYITNGEDTIVVSGVNYPSDNLLNGRFSEFVGEDIEATYSGVPDSLFNITISHTPQLWDRILEQSGANLTLAGHVHSMQIKLHWGDWAWSPARFMYDRWSGLYQEQGRYLYINDGIGYVMFPMRMGTKPEVTIFTLRSTE